jgi:hypothetical protein
MEVRSEEKALPRRTVGASTRSLGVRERGKHGIIGREPSPRARSLRYLVPTLCVGMHTKRREEEIARGV